MIVRYGTANHGVFNHDCTVHGTANHGVFNHDCTVHDVVL